MKIKIIKECSEFLRKSNGNPLIRFLPKEGSDERKVKVRKKKSNVMFDHIFNTVFSSQHPNLRQRAVFCNGVTGLKQIDEIHDSSLEPFYVFPTDGFKYIYSLNVFDSSLQYKETLDKFIEYMNNDTAIETFSEVLKYDYVSTDLATGIEHGCEIIIYSIPYFYAIRASSVKNYSTLFSL